ncbi:MAG: hypothetical protein ACP5UV_03305 [Thermoplasmata archaeon]
MTSKEEKIQFLETQISNDKFMSASGNCLQIAKEEIQLAQLYRSNRDIQKSNDTLADALKVLEDPLCTKTPETDRLIRSLKNFLNNPNMSNIGSMPAIYRYAGFIILIVGYLFIYLLFQIVKLPYDYYFIGIIIIFAISMWAGSALRRSYIRKMKTEDNADKNDFRNS